jgi:DNA-binding transcriptional LysR family regulator
MLDLVTLKHFLVAVRHRNLASAADELHVTPGALSKSLKRLEDELRVKLFDRQGRSLKLNAEGDKLLRRAVPLLTNIEQLQSEFVGAVFAIKCRIAAPALLHQRWSRQAAAKVLATNPAASLTFEQKTESSALAAVLSGECDLAVVTGSSIAPLDVRLHAVEIGVTEFRVAVGAGHPLWARRNGTAIPVEEIITHDFAALLTPPFQSLERHVATDGWRDDVFSRTIRYRSDDLLLIVRLLLEGKALAYLSDDVMLGLPLETLTISGCPYSCRDSVWAVTRANDDRHWVRSLG